MFTILICILILHTRKSTRKNHLYTYSKIILTTKNLCTITLHHEFATYSLNILFVMYLTRVSYFIDQLCTVTTVTVKINILHYPSIFSDHSEDIRFVDIRTQMKDYYQREDLSDYYEVSSYKMAEFPIIAEHHRQ